MTLPHVHYVSMGAPFIPTLAAGLLSRFAPETLPHVLILLPTRRGCLALQKALRSLKPTLALPKMIALADLEQFPLVPGFMPLEDFPEAIPSLERHGLLTKLVLAFEKQRFGRTNTAHATNLAQDLMALMDEAHIAGANLAHIQNLVPDDYAAHWQVTLDFLKIITETWPALLGDRVDAVVRHRDHLLAIAGQWDPAYPVVLAGTTGTRPATATLAKKIAYHPNGLVVLPGFDSLLPSELWITLPATHPQSVLRGFMTFLDVTPHTLTPFHENTPNASATRHELLSRAMRPILEPPTALLPLDAIAGLTMFACNHKQEEAETIALIIRHAWETTTGQIALITPDQELNHRVAAALRRWDISPNSSAGTPLAETVVGTFVRLTSALHPTMTASDWLALLKHPFTLKQEPLPPSEEPEEQTPPRFTHLLNVRAYERRVLRPSSLPFSLLTPVSPDDEPALSLWHTDLLERIQPFLEKAKSRQPRPLHEWVRAHRQLCERLIGHNTDTDNDSFALWSAEDGTDAKQLFEDLETQGHHFPAITFQEYAPLLLTFMTARVRNVEGIGSRVLFLGALEARLQDAETVILGGLNEGTWPKGSADDPWLSRSMRATLGLPDPERKISLSAHDFCLCFSSPSVYLTRSLKVDGAPTIPSRWWQRLEAVLEANNLPTAPQVQPWSTWVRTLNMPETNSLPLQPPAPCPPLSVRPIVYKVTDIGTLMTDPYAVYAQRILKLLPLEPLDAPLSARDRGLLIHAAIDLFFKQHGHRLHQSAHLDTLQTLFVNCGQEVFAPIWDNPAVQTFWWLRFQDISRWILTQCLTDETWIHIATEAPYTLDIPLKDGRVATLRTVIDRLDTLRDGTLRIIDYKTGTPPTQTAVRSGFSPQLPLEAWIVERQTAQDTVKTVQELSYWELKGGQTAGAITSLKSPDVLIDEAAEGATALLNTFTTTDAPYLSRPRHPSKGSGMYAHLARVKEWQHHV